MDVSKVIDKKIDYWKKKLIDLSKRNNLVRYRFTKSKSLKIISPSFIKVIEDLENEQNIFILKEKKDNAKDRQWLCSEDEETVEKKLYALYLKAKENFQELGISTCFLSLGILKYKDADNSELFLEAPIFLWPLEIGRLPTVSKETHKFEIDSNSGEIQLNPALIEKLSHEFGIEINEFENQTPSEYLSYLKKQIEGMKDWKITEDVYLDILSYQKFIMYEDLSFNEKLVKDSPLIKAYVGDRDALQDEISESQRDEFDDANSIDVLPADSSQKRAIELAKAGVTFVLQGPPGTGKSQTITNIIGALIEKNKKVLFVSQKMAALNVVQKRLQEVGLGRYCLNLHTYKGNKKEVINQLMTELLTSPKISSLVERYSFEDYLQTQKEINQYYEYLCQKHSPWDISIYEVRGELAKLYDIEIIDKPLKNMLKLNHKEFLMLKSKIERIDHYFQNIQDPFNHLFFNYKKEKNTTLARNKFNNELGELISELKLLKKELDTIQKKTDIKFDTFNKLGQLAKVESELSKIYSKIIPSWIITKDFKEKERAINGLNKIHSEIQELEAKFSENVKKEFLERSTKDSEHVFKNTSFFKRLFSIDYKKHKNELNTLAKKLLTHNAWIRLFEEKFRYAKITERLEVEMQENKKICSFIGDCKDRKTIQELYQINSKLSPIIDIANNIDNNGYQLVSYIIEGKPKLEKNIKSIEEHSKQLNEFFEKEVFSTDKEVKTLYDISLFTDKEVNKLNDILAFKEEISLVQEEIKEFMKEYVKSNTKAKFSLMLLKSYYLQILDNLAQTSKNAPKQLIEKFRNEDLKVRDIWRYKIMSSIENNQPKETYSGSGANEVYILKRENEKKRRLKPIRDVLQEIPNLVFALKPCFMMSPLTVSQYIDPNLIKFDAVIFDEASQIMPEDAVPCLIRAKQAIIMGDTQQLPPTSFFLSQDDYEVEEEIEDLPSFLSEASTKFREKSLNWHYRSKNENLIAFSNRFFYENRLITFPNSKINDKSGLDFIYVRNSIYDRGKSRKNTEEAKIVVDTYRKLRKVYPKDSVGIVAFSIQQENAIREAFQSAGIIIEETVDPQNEDLFIKNLETVQGDERDIIILSVGYGKDSSGKLSYNFGPLNRESGYKRLNVAITRSRFKTVVIASILPEELDNDKLSAQGLRHLKNYLDYAKNKDFTKFVMTEGIQFDSTFEESVYEALIGKGLQVSTQVGCSGYKLDIAIKHPQKLGEYILGIECDGAQYHSSKYARDRDKIRQLVLESLGWNIHRIWSEDWLSNRDYELEKIKNKIQAISKQKSLMAITKIEQFSKIEEVNDFKEVSLKSKYKKYETCELPQKRITIQFNSYGDLNSYYHSNDLKQRLLKVIEAEGPIDKEILFKRVLDSVGIQKLGNRIENLFEGFLKELKEDKGIYINQNTVALNKINGVSPVRIYTEEQRPFVLIPKEELGSAIVDILKTHFSISKDALITDIAREIYNNQRTGNKIAAKMDITIKYLLTNQFIEEKNGKVQLIKK